MPTVHDAKKAYGELLRLLFNFKKNHLAIFTDATIPEKLKGIATTAYNKHIEVAQTLLTKYQQLLKPHMQELDQPLPETMGKDLNTLSTHLHTIIKTLEHFSAFIQATAETLNRDDVPTKEVIKPTPAGSATTTPRRTTTPTEEHPYTAILKEAGDNLFFTNSLFGLITIINHKLARAGNPATKTLTTILESRKQLLETLQLTHSQIAEEHSQTGTLCKPMQTALLTCNEATTQLMVEISEAYSLATKIYNRWITARQAEQYAKLSHPYSVETDSVDYLGQINSLKTKVKKQEEEIDSLTSTEREQKSQLDEKDALLDGMLADLTTIEKDKNTAEDNLENLQEQMTKLKRQLDAQTTAIKKQKDQLKKYAKRLKKKYLSECALNEKIETLENRIQILESEPVQKIEELTATINKQKARLSKYAERLHNKHLSECALNEKIQTLENRIQTLESELAQKIEEPTAKVAYQNCLKDHLAASQQCSLRLERENQQQRAAIQQLRRELSQWHQFYQQSLHLPTPAHHNHATVWHQYQQSSQPFYQEFPHGHKHTPYRSGQNP